MSTRGMSTSRAGHAEPGRLLCRRVGWVLHGLDMRSRSGSCVGAWDEICASLYPVMQLDSASLHLAHGLRPMDKNV